MSIGTPFRSRKAPVENLLPKAVYMHYLGNTEGIPGNRPIVQFTTNKQNPFGKSGEDYSKSYRWCFVKMVKENR